MSVKTPVTFFTANIEPIGIELVLAVCCDT